MHATLRSENHDTSLLKVCTSALLALSLAGCLEGTLPGTNAVTDTPLDSNNSIGGQANVVSETGPEQSVAGAQDSGAGGVPSAGAAVEAEPTPPEGVVIWAGVDRDVNEGATVNLTAYASADAGEVTSYYWTQVSGPQVHLSDPTQAVVSFTAPRLSGLPLSEATTYPVGDRAISVAIGDLNGDTKPDLAVANFRGNTVSVLLGNGDGTYRNAVDYSVGDAPYSVRIGDINHDNHPDLVTANAHSNDVSVLLNKGDGSYYGAVNYAVGGGPWYADIGDLNGDGHPDLATGNEWTDDASVLLGRGDGTFASKVDYPAGDRSLVGILHDYNKDGYLDLAVTNQNSADVSMLFGNGDGTLDAPSASYAVGVRPRSLQKGDLNGDGNADLVVANEDSDTVSVLLGNADGTFRPAVDYAAGDGPRWAAMGDINGDGTLDLAVASWRSDDISVLYGNGDGSFHAAQHRWIGQRTGPYGVAIGDLNGDGKNDVAVADHLGSSVSVLLNQSNPSLESVPLTFMLTVNNSQGAYYTDEVTLTVHPVP